MTNLALDSTETQCNIFENLKANLFSADVFIDDSSDPDINFYNEKLQEKIRIIIQLKKLVNF